MLRSELKNQAQKILHRKYGKWSMYCLLYVAVVIVGIMLLVFAIPDHDSYYYNYDMGGYYYNDYGGNSGSFGGVFLFLIFLVVMGLALSVYAGFLKWVAIETTEGDMKPMKVSLREFFVTEGKRTIPANLLVVLYTFLWSLLLIIPGIIKQQSYAMTNYLLKKNPRLSAKDAITLSRQMMHGYKMEYLIFQFSFLFWFLGAAYSLGLGGFYVVPYYETSEALFFDQILEETWEQFVPETANDEEADYDVKKWQDFEQSEFEDDMANQGRDVYPKETAAPPVSDDYKDYAANKGVGPQNDDEDFH